jgi:hypothetical protein
LLNVEDGVLPIVQRLRNFGRFVEWDAQVDRVAVKNARETGRDDGCDPPAAKCLGCVFARGTSAEIVAGDDDVTFPGVRCKVGPRFDKSIILDVLSFFQHIGSVPSWDNLIGIFVRAEFPYFAHNCFS